MQLALAVAWPGLAWLGPSVATCAVAHATPTGQRPPSAEQLQLETSVFVSLLDPPAAPSLWISMPHLLLTLSGQ